MAIIGISERGLKAKLNPITSTESLGVSLQGTELLRFTILGEPLPKQRSGYGKRRFYTKAATRKAETDIRWYILSTGNREPERDHQLAIQLSFFCRNGQRKDIDNLIKLVLDACTGFVWVDDVQVIELSARKEIDADNPRTEVIIWRRDRCTADCRTCGKIIQARGRILAIGQNSYCSRTCYDYAQRKGSLKLCAHCQKEVYRQKSRLNQDNVFCSLACRSAYLKGKPLPYRKKEGEETLGR